ncbi:MAG: hypothetical protein SVY53_15125 [Chloroflexota bacterium]|nr:hypothetical protein [Chloroflexota bacterium]
MGIVKSMICRLTDKLAVWLSRSYRFWSYADRMEHEKCLELRKPRTANDNQ